MNADHRLRLLAAQQFGVVSRMQAAELGLGARAVAHRISKGEWRACSPRVLRAAAAPEHPMQHAMAGVLDVGGDACVARSAAAAVWGLPGFRVEPVHVVRGRSTNVRSSPLAIVHTSRDLDEHHVSVVDGLPVVTPLRVVFDLAGRLHPGRVARLVDNAANRGLITYSSLHRGLDEWAGRGRRGVTLLRELASERPPGGRPPESNLEARVNQLLVADGQRPLDRQVDLGEGDWTGRFDLVDRHDRFVLEVHSDRYHGSLLDRRRDAERRAALEAQGWVVEAVWGFEVWHEPEAVVGRVRAGRCRGRARRWATAVPA